MCLEPPADRTIFLANVKIFDSVGPKSVWEFELAYYRCYSPEPVPLGRV
ncbi:hypothetical protein [Streptomyces sp. NPDC048638]